MHKLLWQTRYLGLIGGATVGDNTRRILRELFHHSLAVQLNMSVKNGEFVSFCNNTVDKNWLSQYMESFIVGCSLILWKSNNVPSSFMFMSQGAVVSWTNQEYLYKCLNCITLSHFFKWIGSVFCNHNHISRWGCCICDARCSSRSKSAEADICDELTVLWFAWPLRHQKTRTTAWNQHIVVLAALSYTFSL